MLRRTRNDALQRGDHLFGLRLRRAIRRPVVPRHRIHPGLGIHRRGVIIRRMIGHVLPHCLGIGHVQRLTRRGRVAIVARRQRGNQRLLIGAGRVLQRDRLVDGRKCRHAIGVRHHRLALAGDIDVRPSRQRLAPETHGAVRIERLRRPE